MERVISKELRSDLAETHPKPHKTRTHPFGVVSKDMLLQFDLDLESCSCNDIISLRPYWLHLLLLKEMGRTDNPLFEIYKVDMHNPMEMTLFILLIKTRRRNGSQIRIFQWERNLNLCENLHESLDLQIYWLSITNLLARRTGNF